MTLKDFIVTPLFFVLILGIAFYLRPYLTNQENRRYFLPALTIRMICSILVGLLYQFYYGGGDTFTFHSRGSVYLADAIRSNPISGFGLWYSGETVSGTYEFASNIRYLHDASSFMVIRISALFDLITFNTYSATALLFALVSFAGAWCLFKVFSYYAPNRRQAFAFIILFFPSMVFWSSGIFKDTITQAALSFVMFGVFNIVIRRRNIAWNILLILVSMYLLYSIKIYIVISILPVILLWISHIFRNRVPSKMFRLMITPLFIIVGVAGAFLLLTKLTEGSERYSIDQLSNTVRITAYDIAYGTGKDAGSTYSLGELDGSFESVLRLAPAGLNVALFRPYLWEVRNPLMLLSALESLFVLLFTIYVLFTVGPRGIMRALNNPIILSSLVFAIIFGIAVGVSTFNFGTLSRYKIPLFPFYLSALVLIIEEKKTYRLAFSDKEEYTEA